MTGTSICLRGDHRRCSEKRAFWRGAASLLEEILRLCSDESKTYYLGGYSLAGLFSLWASYQIDRFVIAAASPRCGSRVSALYERARESESGSLLSLGDKEERQRSVMATVGDCIRAAHAWLQQCGIRSTLLEWNPGGNHFRDHKFCYWIAKGI